MSTEFFSEHLVGHEFTNQLRQDIAECSMLRFLVAYVSEAGLETIGRNTLIQALNQFGSFGVSSLSCICGFEPLVLLHCQLPASNSKLKYFLDPKISKTPGDPALVLLHSKLIYLHLKEKRKSVVYIGSHNWTERALGVGAPHNAEASIRIELDYDRKHPLGEGDDVAAKINRHLLKAYSLPACVDASESNRNIFEQWMQAGCGRAPSSNTQDTFIVLAVLRDEFPDLARLNELSQHGIYLRTDDSGEALYNAGHRHVILMLWLSDQDLTNGEQPLLIRCQRTSDNPDPSSNIRSTNTAKSPSEGFGAAIHGGTNIRIWTDRQVQVFDFEFQKGNTTAEQFDLGRPTPQIRFHLDIEEIIFPADMSNHPQLGEIANEFGRWDRSSFAVARQKKDFKFVKLDGYLVSEDQEREIAACLAAEFGITKGVSKVWPTSHVDKLMEGNFEAIHPIHETFLNAKSLQRTGEIEPDERLIVPKLEKGILKKFGLVDQRDSRLEQKQADFENVPKMVQQVIEGSRELPAINKLTEALVKRFTDLFEQWR